MADKRDSDRQPLQRAVLVVACPQHYRNGGAQHLFTGSAMALFGLGAFHDYHTNGNDQRGLNCGYDQHAARIPCPGTPDSFLFALRNGFAGLLPRDDVDRLPTISG